MRFLRWLIIIGFAVAAGLGVRSYLLEGVWVASASMMPTLPVGTHYFVNRFAYHIRSPYRGEIIVFKSPVEDQKGLIKRVIAVAGDTVELRDKVVFVNSQPLTEPYAIHKRARERLIGDNIASLTVPAKTVFVLGDNRDESEDSSVWKDPKTGERIYFVSEQNIEGRLVIP